MVYDVKIAARQGTAEVCEECYRQVYTETMRAIVQDLYGDNRSDVELLHMLQRYKAEILRYRDEVSYTHQLQQMRRYHYFM